MILLQTYFNFPISFKFIAEDIEKVLIASGYEVEKGDYNTHIPNRYYDAVIYIGSLMNQDVGRYYRYIFWTRKHIYYGVTEGPPILSILGKSALMNSVVVVPSNYVKWELENLGIRVDYVIPHGINLNLFNSVGKNNEWRRYVFGKKIVCLYVAHRNLRKGFKELLEAWKLTKASKDENVMLVLHTTSEPNRISGETEIISSNGNVYVTEQILKLDKIGLIKLYKDSDIYIHGALAEGFGLPILEAMACGLPVLTLDAPPMNEINKVEEARVKVEGQRIYNMMGVATFRLNIPDLKDYAEKIDLMVYDESYRNKIREKQLGSIRNYNYLEVYKKFINIIG